MKELKLLEYLKEYLPAIVMALICLFLIWFVNVTHFVLDLSYDSGTLTFIPNDFTIIILSYLAGFLYVYFVKVTTKLRGELSQYRSLIDEINEAAPKQFQEGVEAGLKAYEEEHKNDCNNCQAAKEYGKIKNT